MVRTIVKAGLVLQVKRQKTCHTLRCCKDVRDPLQSIQQVKSETLDEVIEQAF